MKSIFQHSQNLFAAALIALPLLTVSGAMARAEGDQAAQKLANGFARESENDERSRKRASARAAAQIAAEKSAMEAARREAVAAKDNAELQAYRKDLMERVRREADEHRKATLARAKEQQRRADAEKMAGKKITAQRAAAKARKAALAKRQELAKRKAAQVKKQELAKKQKLAQKRELAKRLAAAKKRNIRAQRQAAQNRKNATGNSTGPKAGARKYVILNGKTKRGKTSNAGRKELKRKARKTASRRQPALEPRTSPAAHSGSSKIGSYKTPSPARNRDIEAAALQAESARLSGLEKARNAELLDLDEKLARITKKRKVDAQARKEAAAKARFEARLAAEKKIADDQAKSARLAKGKRDSDNDHRLEAQRLERTKQVQVEQAQGRSTRTTRTDPAWEREQAARLTREAARRFSDRLAARDRGSERRRDIGNHRSYDQERWGNRGRDRNSVSGRSDLDDKFERAERANRADPPRFNEDRFARRDDLDRNDLGQQDLGRKDFDLDKPRAGQKRADGLTGNRDSNQTGTDVIISRYAPPKSAPASAPSRPSYSHAPNFSPAVQTRPVSPPGPANKTARGRPSHVTVLLLMKPGRRGIRRFNKTADPILCVSGGCYVSQGPSSPARFLARRRALGPKNTFGRRAGACKRQLGCIFRNVRLGANALRLQPVDMRVMRHDRRARQVVDAPSRCDVDNGTLTCSNAFNSHDYQMWVIPEDVAAQAGAGGLRAALAAGLRVSTPRAAAGFSEAGYNFRKTSRRDRY